MRARGERSVMVLEEARDSVSCLDVRGHEIVAGSVDGRVRTYDLAMGVVDVDVLGASVTSVEFASEGEGYLASTLDNGARFMERGTGKCLQRFEAEGFVNEGLRLRSGFAMGGANVVAGSEDGSVFVWDVLSGEVTAKLSHREGERSTGKKDAVSAVAWNQARKQWASAGGDGTVVVWGQGG